jgi:hypothetical protein
MKRDVRAPVIRLLTVIEAADRLELIPADVDRMVERGNLQAVNVSPHGGRRFWPADVEALATARADGSESIGSVVGVMAAVVLVPTVAADAPPSHAAGPVAGPPHRARTQLEQAPQHPRWPRFEVAPERPSSNYLAFRDAEHVTAYLRARATLDLDPSKSVHRDPARSLPELVPG